MSVKQDYLQQLCEKDTMIDRWIGMVYSQIWTEYTSGAILWYLVICSSKAVLLMEWMQGVTA